MFPPQIEVLMHLLTECLLNAATDTRKDLPFWMQTVSSYATDFFNETLRVCMAAFMIHGTKGRSGSLVMPWKIRF